MFAGAGGVCGVGVGFGAGAEELGLGGVGGDDRDVDADGVSVELDDEVHAVLVVAGGGVRFCSFVQVRWRWLLM